jgi:hypothetical protein
MTSRHLSDEELLDALEGEGPSAARAHAAGCTLCSSRLDEARDGLGLTRQAEVPEPAPLYWDAFRRQVGRRVADEGRNRWRAWFLPALAAAGLALVVWGPRPPHVPAPQPLLPAWSALPAESEDEGLAVVQVFAPTIDDLRPLAGCGRGSVCLPELSDEESRALLKALEGEMKEKTL